MTDRAIEARRELEAWISRYSPETNQDYSGCYYPDEHPTIQICVDDVVIATSSGFGGIEIQK